MIIDSIAGRTGINIEELNFDLPEKRRQHFFDEEHVVSDGEWTEMVRWQRLYASLARLTQRPEQAEPEDWSDFVRMTSAMTIAFPSRVADLGIIDSDRKRIYSWFNRNMLENGDSATWLVSNRSVLMMMLGLPEIASSLQFGPAVLADLRKRVLERMTQAEFCDSGKTASEILTTFAVGKILLPDINRSLLVDEAVWNAITNELEMRLGNELVRGTNIRIYRALVGSLMFLRLMGPENRMSKFLNERTKKRMMDFFEVLKHNQMWKYLVECAAALRVLDADVARITPEGQIEIIKDKKELDMTKRIPEMPVKRAF